MHNTSSHEERFSSSADYWPVCSAMYVSLNKLTHCNLGGGGSVPCDLFHDACDVIYPPPPQKNDTRL